MYHETHNIRHTLVDYKFVDYSDVVGAPNTRSQWIGQRQLPDETIDNQSVEFGASHILLISTTYFCPDNNHLDRLFDSLIK